MRKLLSFPLFLALILVIVPVSNAVTMAPELQSALESLGPDEEIPVIITLSDKVDSTVFKEMNKSLQRSRMIKELKGRADVSQRMLKAFLESKGAKRLRPLWIINGIAEIARADVIRELEGQPGIEDIRLDTTVQVPPINYETLSLPEWNLDMIQASGLWNLGFRGGGIVVASMDTGVDLNHPDLMPKWRGGTNSWYDPNGEHKTPYDADGHGTQTMGVIVGGDAGGTAIGVAPDAKWIAVKIFNDSGKALLSTIHQGFQWLLDPDGNPDTDDAPDIINNSWGLNKANTCSTEFQTDIQTLKAADIAVVFSAGNSGPYDSTSVSPANNTGAFAVGAIDSSSKIAFFSSRGPSACDGDIYPEVVAPGVNIRTSDLTSGGIFPDSYVTVSGTSFSSPHVAGAMALLLSAFPDATVSELEAALKQSASDLGTPGADNVYGYGLIDLIEAYTLLANPIADIKVLPSSCDFGTAKIGSVSSSKVFTVTNQGTTGLVIGAISITGLNSSEFKISSDNCSGKTLGPLSICKLEVMLSPSSEGIKNATLSVPSNDPDTPVLAILLEGAGVPASLKNVTLITPNGGEVIPSGSIFTIRWYAPARAVKFKLLLSFDNGSTWTPIPNADHLNGTTFQWSVPKPWGNKRTCLIKVIGYDASHARVNADISNESFSIEVVKLISPDGGISYSSADPLLIKWTTNATKRPVAKVKLYYTKDGGITWNRITTIKGGNPGSYLWMEPQVTKNKCRIKIELKDEFGDILGADASDRNFEIKSP